MTMTACSSKRKSDCLTTDRISGDGAAEALQALSNIVHEHIETSTRSIEALNKRVKSMEELMQRKPGNQDTLINDNDISDDEESVITPSDKWVPMFRLLREYRITNGHCKVREKDDKKLSTWIKNQKFFFTNTVGKKKGSKLSPEKILKLESLGFEFGSKHTPPPSWEEMCEQLKNYKKRIGNCDVPHNDTNPTPLAKWLAFQRKEYMHFRFGRPSLITLEQIRILNELGVNWKGQKLPK